MSGFYVFPVRHTRFCNVPREATFRVLALAGLAALDFFLGGQKTVDNAEQMFAQKRFPVCTL